MYLNNIIVPQFLQDFNLSNRSELDPILGISIRAKLTHPDLLDGHHPITNRVDRLAHHTELASTQDLLRFVAVIEGNLSLAHG